MSSIYSIVPRIRTPRVNPGETVEVEIFLTGYGEIPKLRTFKISHSSPYLYKRDSKSKIGVLEWCIKVAENEKGDIIGVWTGDSEADIRARGKVTHIRAHEEHPVDPFGVIVELNPGYFLSHKEVARLEGEPVDEHDRRILSEMTHDEIPPMLLKLNTLENARSGDHDIFLTLIYHDGAELKMDQKVVRFHVNSWIERHAKTLQWVVVVLGLLALCMEIIQAISSVLPYLAFLFC